MVVIVSNRESAIWRKAGVKTVLREHRLKYVNVEGMRVITSQTTDAKQNTSRMMKRRTS